MCAARETVSAAWIRTVANPVDDAEESALPAGRLVKCPSCNCGSRTKWFTCGRRAADYVACLRSPTLQFERLGRGYGRSCGVGPGEKILAITLEDGSVVISHSTAELSS